MKAIKPIVLIAVLFLTIYSCSKETEEPHIFKRGQIISSSYLAYKTTDDMKLVFSFLGVEDSINYQYPIELYKIKYETITPQGEETVASGLVVVPKNTSATLPLVSFNHGTELNKLTVPSRLVYNSGFEVGMMFATEGYAVCIPDYLGLGDGTGLHPYMHAKSEASSTIDMIRAAKEFCNQKSIKLNEQLFLVGYSQGGHASMATHKEIEANFAGEFTVTANASLAGPYDVSGIMSEILFKKEAFPSPVFLPYVLFAYNDVYSIYSNISSILKSPYNSTLLPFFDGTHKNTVNDVNNAMPSIPSDILTDEEYLNLKNNTNVKFFNALKENDLYNWTPIAPIQMCHCDGDITVPMGNSEKALQYFISHGVSNAKLVNPLAAGTHQTCLIPSLLATKRWFAGMKN